MTPPWAESHAPSTKKCYRKKDKNGIYTRILGLFGENILPLSPYMHRGLGGFHPPSKRKMYTVGGEKKEKGKNQAKNNKN